jgi:hypothetical protein
MFAQFRAQYPQGSLKTEMLSKVDGLHVFRATVSHGDLVLGTGTAADPDLEVAEDRAVKRALAIAGLSFDHNYSMQATLMPQQNARNVLPKISAPKISNESLPPAQLDLTDPSSNYQSNFESDYSSGYGDYEDNYQPSATDSYSYEEPDPEPQIAILDTPKATKPATTKSSVKTEVAPEPIDLSDALAQTQVEMERLGWTVNQGREYLQRSFKKRSRQQLDATEIIQFLSYLKLQPTPQKI